MIVDAQNRKVEELDSIDLISIGSNNLDNKNLKTDNKNLDISESVKMIPVTISPSQLLK